MADVTLLGTAIDTDRHARIEALKMAYEVAFKTDELNSRQSPEVRWDNLKEIMDLAELNFQFIKGEQLTW